MKLFLAMGKSCATCLHARILGPYASVMACSFTPTDFVAFYHCCEKYSWFAEWRYKKL